MPVLDSCLPPRALVAVPTYRRPDKLARLLASLESSLLSVPVLVVVADNACEDATRVVVEHFGAKHPGVSYLPVPERGITANRNALLSAFLAVTSEPLWLAMVDDDLELPPFWLERLIETGERHDADVVGAPYAMAQPTGRFVIDQSVFVKRPRPPSGPCGAIATAGNILLSRRLLAAEPPLRFDPAFGLSGGEDYDFFRRAAERKARFAWCNEAFAVEDVDVDRLNARAVLWRYYSTGNYMALIDARRDGRGKVWRRSLTDLFKSMAVVLQGAVTFDRARALRGLFLGLFNAGALTALSGLRFYRYR